MSPIQEAHSSLIGALQAAGLKAYPADTVVTQPPYAVVALERVDYTLTNAGANEIEFIVRVLVGRADDVRSIDALYAFVDGDRSLVTMIEDDPNTPFATQVMNADNFGFYQVGGATYLGFEATVIVNL